MLLYRRGMKLDSNFDWVFVAKYTVNLALLLGLLTYLLKNPLMSFLKNRKERLRSEVDRAAREAKNARQTLEDYSARLKAVSEEIKTLEENIKKQGTTERDEIVSQAHKSCEMIKREVQDTIRLETTKAVTEIQEEVVNSALALAEKMIKERVDRDFATSSVDDLIKMIEQGKWQQLQH